MNIKKILLFCLLIMFLPYLIVDYFIRDDEIRFYFSSNSMVRVYRQKSNKVDRVPIEQYVIGVVSGEMPVNFEIEALKAQAVASRSYVMFQMERNKDKDYDVFDSVKNQVYLDIADQKERWQEQYVENANKIKQAVLSTAGEYLIYDGKIVEAMFFSTSTGMTENSEDVFSSNVPYLRSVVSSWDEISPAFKDSKTFNKKEFYEALDLDYQEKLNVQVTETTSTGRVLKLLINNHSFTGKEVYSKLHLKSTFFDISEFDDSIVVNTHGYGHGVGMSQYGAQGMAKEGYKYDEILKYYYSGVDIRKY
ncbi:MAG: stage II sporulation protein D [Bacilli bacterium]|nr:stage II sporulation protein D [Bacilli bacterium]